MTLKTDTEINRNRMSTSLEMRVRLKLNAKALAWSLNLWLSAIASRLAIWVNVDSWQLHYACQYCYGASMQMTVFEYCRWQNCYWNDVNTETETELKLFIKKLYRN